MTRREGRRVTSHCNVCLGEKNHEVLHEKKTDAQEVDFGCVITWTTTTQLLECEGCGDVSLVRSVYCDEDGHTRTHRYPPAIARQKPKWHADLPTQYHQLLAEVYEALHADSRTLVLMGVRALVDIYLVHQIRDVGGFGEKLRLLAERGDLSAKDVEMLNPAIEAGSAAAHRGYQPSAEEVEVVLDIAEHLLRKEILGPASVQVKEATPPRVRAQNR